MKFHKRSIRLAGFYLIIIMVISIFFSANVYQLSVQELERGLRRTGQALNDPVNRTIPNRLRQQLFDEREELFKDAKERVAQRLLFTNLLILVGGGILSYFLALRTLKPIEEANESLERFTADASHELRTPITAMRTENEVALMNSKLTTLQAKKILQSNIEELDKLTDLMNGLLRLASLDKTQLQLKSIAVENLVQESVQRTLPLAEKKDILVTTKIGGPATVICDQTSIVEALVILVDNAIKYSPRKSEVSIVVRKSGKNTAIEVADKGVGIKATALPHIFERFYRADSSRNKQHANGYGLGLSIAKDIVALHGGDISVTSTPGKGSTFTVQIPTKQ